ncbi:hypothetical protein [Variovorax gossypii]
MRRILSLLLLLLAIQPTWAQTNYSKTAELPALRVSFSDLQGVVDKVSTLTANANGGARAREEVKLKAGKTEVAIGGRLLLPSGAKVPDQIDTFSYSYASSAEDAPIKRVYLDFRDYSRTLTVEGSSPEQVDAVFVTIREELNTLSSVIGGGAWTILFGVPVYIVLGFLLLWSFATWVPERHPAVLVLLIFSVAALILTLVLPMKELLAGFMATKGEPSLLVRYAPQIGFVGLALSIAPLLTAAFRRLSSAPRAKTSTPAEVPEATQPTVTASAPATPQTDRSLDI